MTLLVDRFPRWWWLLVVALLLGTSLAQAQTASQLYSQGVMAYNQGDVEQAKVKLQQTLEVDRNFRPASALLGRINLEQRAAAATDTGGPAPVSRRTLDQTVVPVEFRDTSLQTALEYLRQQIERATGGRSQVNFVLNVPPEVANKKVTLQMNHVPVTALLQYLGELAGVTFSVEKYAIVATPAAGPATAPAGNSPATNAPAP